MPDTTMMNAPRYALLDASAAIVLFASGHIKDILAAWPDKVGIVEQTLAEVLFLRDRLVPDRQSAAERISFDPLLKSGLISVLSLQSPAEYSSFLRFARSLDDGEAAAAAMAFEHGFDLVIDDRKAHTVLRDQITMRWSLEMVWHWSRVNSAQEEATTATLINIRRRASYLPHRTHPLRAWWDAHVPDA